MNRARLGAVRPPVAALAPLATAICWTIALIVDAGPFPVVPSVLLVGIGLLVVSTVSTVGLVVLGARWSHRLAWGVLAVGGAIAAVRPVDAAWVAALVATVASGVALVTLQGKIRKLPSASGPPDQAVLLPLVLIAAPVALGLTASGAAWAVLTVGLSALVAAFMYSRVVFGGLVAVRYAWPLVAVAACFSMDLPALLVTVALAAAVLYLAWHPSAKVAFHPPVEAGSTFPIPPELAPRDILDAAGLDDRGRWKE